MPAYGYKSFTVETAAGTPVQDVSVYIYEEGTSTLADLFSTDSGTPKANPLVTNVNGVVTFYVAPGLYDAKFVHASYAEKWDRSFRVVTADDAEGVQEVSVDTVLTAEDLYTDCDCTSAAIAITLPHLADVSELNVYGVKKIDSSGNAVTIANPDGATIESAANVQLTLQNEGVWVAKRGTVWRIVGRM